MTKEEAAFECLFHAGLLPTLTLFPAVVRIFQWWGIDCDYGVDNGWKRRRGIGRRCSDKEKRKARNEKWRKRESKEGCDRRM